MVLAAACAMTLAAAGPARAEKASCLPASEDGSPLTVKGRVTEFPGQPGALLFVVDYCLIDVVVPDPARADGTCRPGGRFSATGTFEACHDAECFELFGETLWTDEVVCR